MTPNLIPIYGCAVLTIAILCLFARQNRKSGWKRHRASNFAEAIQDFYADLGISTEEQTAAVEWKPVNEPDNIGFSAQMLKLRLALGSSSPVTPGSPMHQHELVLR